ncbi:MAG: ABC-type transport auxiliary lipoprotein family protein [Nitrospiraceae bacterium]
MMRCRRIHLELMLVFAAVILEVAGCIRLAKGPPEKHYYALEVTRPAESPAPSAGAILKIRKLRISPRFEGAEIVYRTSEARYQSDFYNEWFIAPSAMVTQQLQNWLTNARLFQHVVDTSSSLEAGYLLEGVVNALYGDLRLNGSPKAILAMQIVVIRDRPAREEIVFRREYQEVADVADPSPDALVRGWNQGLRHSLMALEEDLRDADLDTGDLKRGP